MLDPALRSTSRRSLTQWYRAVYRHQQHRAEVVMRTEHLHHWLRSCCRKGLSALLACQLARKNAILSGRELPLRKDVLR